LKLYSQNQIKPRNLGNKICANKFNTIPPPSYYRSAVFAGTR